MSQDPKPMTAQEEQEVADAIDQVAAERERRNDTYLGDGLYASFDGYQIELYAFDGIGKTNRVFLEPAVLAAFERYCAALKPSFHQEHRLQKGEEEEP